MRYRSALLIAILFFAGLIFSASAHADGPSNADEKILEKLDSIEKKQDEILRQLGELKEEMYVIKIRTSLKA